MNRLPVTEDKLTLILEFLKANQENRYTRRQIGQYLWDNYSYCEFKTFDQILREVSDKISVHVNKYNRYTQTVPLQIEEHNTFPFTYQYLDVAKNTTLQNIEVTPKVFKPTVEVSISPQLQFEGLMDYEEVVVAEENVVEEVVEEVVVAVGDAVEDAPEATLLEDIKASDIISKTNDSEVSLIHWLNTTDDLHGTMSKIIKIMAQYA
jgi:hypothetical protein